MCKKKKKRGYMLKSSPFQRPLGLVKATKRGAVLVLGKASKYSIWKTLVCCCPGVREMQDGGSGGAGVWGLACHTRASMFDVCILECLCKGFMTVQ